MSRVNLPITPMLDMTFQLLFFFIISFNPADLEGAVELALPSEGGRPALGRPVAPPVAVPEFPTDVTVVARADGAGGGRLSFLAVRNQEGNEHAVDGVAGLGRHLAEVRPGLQERQALRLQGDGRLSVAALLGVMDACREAGFRDVRLVPPE